LHGFKTSGKNYGYCPVQSLANSNQNRITLLEQEVGNLRAMFNNQPSAQDILNLMYPVGSISLAAPLNGTGGGFGVVLVTHI